MARRRRWTKKKRQRARLKANAALRERKRIIEASRDREDTSYAGMVPVVEFGKQLLRVPQRLGRALKMKKGKTAVYTPVDEAMAYLGSQMAGIARLNQIDRLLPEGVLAEMLGLPRWPSHDTEQRFLRRAKEDTLEGVGRLTQRVIVEQELEWSTGLIEVDGDVTGIPQRARKREGVEPGYCGGRVRPCYQLPRVTVNGLAWWSDLRRGADGCTDLFGRTRETAVKLAQEHPRREVVYRLDGYFASKEHLREATEAGRPKNLKFFLAIHDSKMKEGRWADLVAAAPGRWKRVNSTTEIKEVGRVRPWEDAPAVRAVGVRRQKRDPRGRKRKKKGPKEWDLQYLIVTDASRRRMGTRKVFDRYHQRQREEFSFKDGKQSLPIGKIPTGKLMANRAHAKMVALAQVMLQLFTRMFLPHAGRYGPTCKTIREKVIAVGGKNHRREGGGAGPDLLRVSLAEAFGGEGPR